MPRKTIQYYLSTIVLKIKGIGYSLIPVSWSKSYFEQLWLDHFNTEHTTLNQQFDWQYYALSHYQHPDDFEGLYRFDEERIPLSRKDFTPVFYNPLNPAQFGLINYSVYIIEGNKARLQIADKMNAYLQGKAILKENALWFAYDIDYPKFKLKAPWFSGIAQAQILSLMLRLYREQPTDSKKTQIDLVFRTLIKPVEEGGLLTNTPEGYKWIEEYPGQESSYVLNGFMFCLIAVYEYQLTFPGNDINALSIQLTKSLMLSLHHYKRGKYWRYSRLHNTLSNIEYQGVYVNLFKHLWLLTGNQAFKILYEKGNKNMNWKAFNSFYRFS